jgi:glutathione synthase/RimK-type ligase-like ATP-grasp enzyme
VTATVDAPRLVLVGNPENRRVGLFRQALRAAGRDAAAVVAWRDLLAGDPSSFAAVRTAEVVRLDSPGENADVECALIARGQRATGERRFAPEELAAAVADTGRIVAPSLWFAGFRDVLSELEAAARGVRWTIPPADVVRMFDKPTCLRLLREAGIPTPEPLGIVRSFAELRRLVAETGCRRLFVKVPWSSSASGVVALEWGTDRIRATTSVEMVREADAPSGPAGVRLYNSLRVRRYETEREVEALLDALGTDGLHVERWIPKAGSQGAAFDLRVLVVAGETRQIVMRCSEGPLTNLHLGNRRGDVALLRSQVPAAAWEAALRSCEDAARVFPGSLAFGVDLLFAPRCARHAVVEVNAFGDLLPGVLDRGQDSYAAQVEALPRWCGA